MLTYEKNFEPIIFCHFLVHKYPKTMTFIWKIMTHANILIDKRWVKRAQKITVLPDGEKNQAIGNTVAITTVNNANG